MPRLLGKARKAAGPLVLASVVWGLLGPVEPERIDVVHAAQVELGSTDWRRYQDDALCYHEPKKLHWCGLFVLASMHRAGVAEDWCWKPGLGFLYRLPRIPKGALPEPADVAYFARPYQHHAMVEWVSPDGTTVSLLNGNGAGGRVTRTSRPLTDATAYYSTAPLFAGRAAE